MSVFGPVNGVGRSNSGPLGPILHPAVRNQKLAVSWARWTELRFRGHFVSVPAPVFGGPLLRMARTHRWTWSLPAVCPFSCALGVFLACACPRKVGPKWVKSRWKIMSPKSNPGLHGVPGYVFLACFEASLGQFDTPHVPESEPFCGLKTVPRRA